MAFQARTIAQIQSQIIASKNANSDLSGLTSTSQVSYWNLWSFITAVAISLLEQIMVIFFSEITTIEGQSHGGTATWIQNEVLQFQYPDVVQVNSDFSIGYATFNSALQIISNCAVTTTGNGQVVIKAITSGGALTADEKTALNSYLQTILSPSQIYSVISQAADNMVVQGTVFYNGQYAAAIQSNVIAALQAYITKFSTSPYNGGSFNGVVKLSDIENVILSVPGIVDWQPLNVNVTPFGGASFPLMTNGTINSRLYQSYAGYIAESDAFSLLTFTVSQQ